MKTLLPIFCLLALSCKPSPPEAPARNLPRVLITTDINLLGGDPDDNQSLIHLLWYADELDIVGIVPDNWKAEGPQAALKGLEKYQQDYTAGNWGEKGYPSPEQLKEKIALTPAAAKEMILTEGRKPEAPLYVLVWGQMTSLKEALFEAPEIAQNLRVLTIGTGRKYGPKDEVKGEDCEVVNWNGKGRNEIYEDARFDQMWWLESNWTYNGMFGGERPKELMDQLQAFGAMGVHIKQVTDRHKWAQYFRAGDTPSVLYLLDPDHDPDDPTTSSWAGQFAHPFPDQRPHYYTDFNGEISWDYADPCQSWDQVERMYAFNKSTLADRREDMYAALLQKLERLYAVE
ncbi:MAG: nucleoside hydrolase-like domain-containing protein [Bacteroidota bacterium]